MRPVVESLVNEALGTWLEEHPGEADDHCQSHPGRCGTRGGAAPRTIRHVMSVSTLGNWPLPKKTAKSEIFIVEASAGGSAKGGRSPRPVRSGKILNVERVRLDRMPEMIGTLITALGAGSVARAAN